MRAVMLAAVVAVAAGLLGPVAQAAPLVRTEPSLVPEFRRAITDFVVRCPDRTLTIDAPGRATRTVPIEPGQAVPVTVQHDHLVTHHFVRCLPDDFPVWHYERVGRQVPRWFFVTPGVSFEHPPKSFVAVFDQRGVPVWWYRSASPVVHNAHLLKGKIAYAESLPGAFNPDANLAYKVRRLDGSLARTIRTVGSPTDFHDLDHIGADDLVLTYRARPHVDLSTYGGPADAVVLDSEIQRVDGRGEVVWSWSSRDHIDLAETGRWWPDVIKTPVALPDGSAGYDVTHINAIERIGDGDLLISLRHTDAVYRIRMRDGRTRWKLGGTHTSRSLKVVADPAEYPLGGQHDVGLWNGTVTIHDNATNLSRYPRVVRYAIDPARRTATLVENIADARVLSSICCGSARKLEDGNWLIGWGGDGVSSLLTPGGALVSRLTLDDLFSYRTVSAPADTLSRADLRKGMDALFIAGDAD